MTLDKILDLVETIMAIHFSMLLFTNVPMMLPRVFKTISWCDFSRSKIFFFQFGSLGFTVSHTKLIVVLSAGLNLSISIISWIKRAIVNIMFLVTYPGYPEAHNNYCYVQDLGPIHTSRSLDQVVHGSLVNGAGYDRVAHRLSGHRTC